MAVVCLSSWTIKTKSPGSQVVCSFVPLVLFCGKLRNVYNFNIHMLASENANPSLDMKTYRHNSTQAKWVIVPLFLLFQKHHGVDLTWCSRQVANQPFEAKQALYSGSLRTRAPQRPLFCLTALSLIPNKTPDKTTIHICWPGGNKSTRHHCDN